MQLTPFFVYFSHSDCPTCGQFGSLLQKRWLTFQHSLFDAVHWIDTLYDVSLFRISRALWTNSRSC